MRLWFSYILTVILLCTLAGVWVWVAHPAFKNTAVFSSPLPAFLTSFINNQVTTLDVWKPKNHKVLSVSIEKPEIDAQEVLVYDLTKDKVAYEKNPTVRRPIASLTKIMTAIIALENPKKVDEYFVSEDALVGEDAMGVTAGEIFTLEELLFGLLLPSGNDAAEVLANNFTGGRQTFIAAMNNKAKALGLSDTNFTNPSGLQGDGDQYSTANDLLVITRYALREFPLFRKVVATYEHQIPYSLKHKALYLQNATNLISSYPGVKGVKSGYTPEANLCLVTYLNYEGHEYIGIILGSNNRREEMKQLLDYALKVSGITPPPHQ